MLVFLLIVLHSKHLHIGLAPVNVTVQAAAQRPGPAAARGVQGRADRLRGSRRGRGAGSRQDRGLHLEGLPRLHHLHRVRPLPVAVPGLEHRQAAVAQARDHEPARPPVRQGALHPRRQGRRRSRTPPKAARRDSPTTKHEDAPRARVRLRARARRLGPRAGHPAAGRHRRAGRRHRPRRAVVLHHLRRLRRAVPGRHRAHRPHRRHAPLPGDDRVGVPRRARRAVQEPGEQGQPLGPERQGPHQLDRRGRLRRPGLRQGRRLLRRLRVPVLGRLRRRLRGPRQEDHQGRRRTARHRRA